MSDLKNDICSFQSHLKITRSLRRTNMIKKLNNLKLNYRENAEEIFELESKLNKILHSELICELEKYQLFEQVNSEKISPFYLKLVKSGKPSEKLSDLKKNDGCNFENEGELKKFVFDYYAGLYKKNENNANIYNGCIRDFLGEDIYNHPIVQDSILTLQEREMLEAPLTSQELEKAVKESNKKSSVGIDGIGYPFIIQFWEFLGTPLLKYAHCCFASGKLTSSFSTAVVKLISKKGDCSKIKNRRPISLLSCMYKIISRALNSRLKRVLDRVTSRAQKGFNKSRSLQEVWINIIEKIQYCKANNIKGALVTIDIAKAFDTIDH
jgi:hypothetical protein